MNTDCAYVDTNCTVSASDAANDNHSILAGERVQVLDPDLADWLAAYMGSLTWKVGRIGTKAIYLVPALNSGDRAQAKPREFGIRPDLIRSAAPRATIRLSERL